MKSYRLLISLMIVVAFSLGFSPKVVKMVDNVNTTGFSTFAPVASPDGEVLYFTSDRSGGMGEQDIWVSHFVNGQWTQAVNLSKTINTAANESADSFVYDHDNIFLYMTLCNRKDGRGMCDIYFSAYDPDGTWTEPKNIGAPIDTEWNEANAVFDPREEILYFTSNRPGGLGTGMRKGESSYDIWYSKRMAEGKWSEPKNIGASINTPDREEKAYFDVATGWLFFSSDGHGGKGMDIFKVKRISPDSWGDVMPVDAVNSEGNDSYFTLSENSDYAYFSSDVSGKNQIYLVPLTEIFTPEEIAARDKFYRSNMPPGVPAVGDMAIVFKKKFCTAGPATCPPCQVAGIEQPKIANLIYFQLGKADLNAEAVKTASEWAKYMKDNPSRKIEIDGHADTVGDDTYNLILSKKRADAVKAVMIKDGAKPAQLLPAYFGAVRPAVPNDPKDGAAKNRRVELKVIE